LKKQQVLPAGTAFRTFPGAGTTYKLQVVSLGEPYSQNPAKFDRLIDSSKIYRKHLSSDTQRDGIGGTLVGVIESPANVPNRAPGGFAEPITAVADFGKSSRHGETSVDLFFFDPRTKEAIILDHTTFPLGGDFTGPLAYFPRTRPLLLGFAAMMRSDRVAKRQGIYFLEPFNPNKIPILFSHGLMSSPHAWIDFINKLNENPDFRRRYQPWVLFYPSGGPIAGNALQLRMMLAQIAKDYPLKHNLVLVGHSMGGILTQMQVVNTGRVLWDTVFGKNANKVYAMFPPTSMIKKALIFQANPDVSSVIFFSTPHLGSKLADMRISWIVGSLVRMPTNLVRNFNPQMRSILQEINPAVRSIPSSIIGLSPSNPLLKGLAKLPITVPYYSIIGNQGKDSLPLAESSDGIVPYWSSHLDGAKSELIVPTGHDSFDNPKSVTEVLRILAIKK
jgi:hypothetical protein